jgi:replicative DNA helicase
MIATAPDPTRLPPFNRDAERGVLGGILRDPDALHDVRAALRPQEFYFDAHGTIYRAMCDIADRAVPIDLVTLRERLVAARAFEDIGGTPYLADLWDAVPTAANVEYHAKIVRETATVRGLIHASNEILRDAYDRVGSADELVASAERKFFDLSANGDGDDLIGAADLARDALHAIDERASRDGPDGLLTGFADLDQVFSGMRAGQLIVIGARPSVGKTAMALGIASENAAAGHGVLFASLEMPAGELTDRVLSIRSGVGLRPIREGRLSEDQADAVNRAAQRFGREPFFVTDAPDITAARLASMVRRGVRRRGLKLVIVDYLQLIRPENDRDPRHLQVGTLARRLKQLARTCGVPVVLLCQLNRESENRPGGKPRLSDLRESGEIEQHADIVVLLHRHEEQPANAAVWSVDAVVAKNRNGPVAEVPLAYRRVLARYENAAKV